MLHLAFQTDTDTLPRGPGDEEMSKRENEREEKGERKASIIQHSPDPCIRAPLKIGNP